MFLFWCLLFAILVYYFNSKYYRVQRLLAKFPGPSRLELIANACMAVFNSSTLNFNDVRKQYRAIYGRVYRIFGLCEGTLIVSEPKVVEIILSDKTYHLDKGWTYNMLKPWLGTGLLLKTRVPWQHRRKAIAPGLSYDALKYFVTIFNRQSDVLTEKLMSHCNHGEFDICKPVALYVFDVMIESTSGKNFNSLTNNDSKYVDAMDSLTEIIAQRIPNVWLHSEFLFKVFARHMKQKLDQNIKILHNFATSMIAERREYLQNPPIGSKIELTFLDIWLGLTEEGEPLSNEELMYEVVAGIFGAHDTTSAALSFCLYLMSRNKEVQDRVFQEIIEVCGSNKYSALTMEQIQKLNYMDLVIKETLRMYPPVPNISRRIGKDIDLDDGVIIPVGTTVSISIAMMSRDGKYFSQPDQFNPERFRSESEDGKHNAYAYSPFSAGIRSCVGRKYAMFEIKYAVTKILFHYELLPQGEEPIIRQDLITKSENGLQLGLRLRQNA